MRRKTGTTIDDVAMAAKVSAMSVSRALRGIEGVSHETRRRIFGIAKELGYVPDSNARSISQSSSNLIGISVPTLFNDVFADMLSIMREKLARAGFETLVDTSDYNVKRERAWIETILSWRPAALVMTGAHREPALRDYLRSRNIAVLELWEHTADPIDLCVGIDQFEAGKSIGEYVAGLGYRNPAYVGEPLGRDPRAELRLTGIAEAFRSIRPEGLRTRRVPLTNAFEAGHSGTLELLGSEETSWPDVIFYHNDHTAFGGMTACQKLNIDVPGRVGIVGFNALRITKVLPIEMTTVASQRQRIGEIGARNLIARIKGAKVEKTVCLAVDIIAGATTRRQ